MSNSKKITELEEVVSPSGDDVIAIVSDGVTKKVKKSNLATALNVETPVGTVDGSNVTFTVSNEPKYVIVDGLTRFVGFGYTYAGGTITVDALAPPVEHIRSIY